MDPVDTTAPLTAPPTGDELLAELRQQAQGPLRPEGPKLLTTLDITLEEATTLYAALHKKIARPPRPKPGSGREELPPQLFGQWLELLGNQVRELPETHPFGRKKPRRVTLGIMPWEAGYLKRMVNNKKRDEARKDADYYALRAEGEKRRTEIAARGGKRRLSGFMGPIKPPDCEANLTRDEFMDALDSCPRGLELAIYLNLTDGNVSRVSRLFSQPQRTVAHAVARLRKHLLGRGYSA